MVTGPSGDQPAVVAADSPHSDAGYWLGVKHAAVHGVNQVQHIVLQEQKHVLPLSWTNKHRQIPFRSHNKNMQSLFPGAQDFVGGVGR